MGTLRCTSGLTVDAGGVTVTAGTITQSAGNLAVSAGGVDLPVETSTGDLAAYGLSVVTSTKAGTFDIGTPTIGVEKFVTLTGAASTFAVVVRASTAGTVTLDGTNHIATFTSSGSVGRGLHLIGRSTAAWAVAATYGTVAFSTS